MKKILSLVLCALLLFCNAVTLNVQATYSSEETVTEKETTLDNLTYSPDRVIVKLKTVKKSTITLASTYMSASPQLPDLGIETADVRLINPSNVTGGLTKQVSVCSNQEETSNNMYVVTLKDSGARAVQNALNTLRNNPNIEYAVRDIYLKTCAVPNDDGYISTAYNALNHINAPKAWDITTGSKDVVVGIIDTGIDGNHEDLKDNLWVNPKPNRNGYKNDIHGYDFVNRKGGTPTDSGYHGTHVAGIVGAKGNNGVGICGVNWNVQLAWLRVSDDADKLSLSAAVEAINYANNNNIPIVNASWGGYACFNDYDEYIPLKEAIENYKGLFVAAAGNDAVNNDMYPHYPASFDLPNIISVGATSHGFSVPAVLYAQSRNGFSNYGVNSVDILASNSVYSSVPGNEYQELAGTSMASPLVAGVAALVKAKHPNYTAAQIKNAILNGATKNVPYLIGEVKDGAVLNAYGALLDTKPRPQTMEIGPVASKFSVEAGQTMKLYANITPVESDQAVIWSSNNADVIEMTKDGCYIAHKAGTAIITATSTVNPDCKDTVTVTVTPAVSEVVEFKEPNFKEYFSKELNSITATRVTGIRYKDSKIYLSEVEAEDAISLKGTDVDSLDDLKYFKNLEHLKLAGIDLKGELDLTEFNKLRYLSVNPVASTSLVFYNYEKDQYKNALTLTRIKAYIGGEYVDLNLKGSGFMDVELKNWENNNNCSISVFYESLHKPVNSTLNGEKFYHSEHSLAWYSFTLDKPTDIDIEVQPGIDIQNPSIYQSIGEKLKKVDSKWYTYFDWKSGYKLTASDVFEFNQWKPMCQYDLDLAGVSNPYVTLSQTSYTYNGKVQTPSVIVKDIEGNALKKDRDYTVLYSKGRKAVGTYYVTVKFKGKYSGTKKLAFKINPIKASVCTAKLSTSAYYYNGKVRTPSVTVKNTKGVTLKKGTHYTVKYATGRKNVGKYKVTVTFIGNYSGTKNLYFKINPVKTAVSKLTSGKKSIKVYVNKKSSQVTGYQIKYSTSKTFKSYKIKTIPSYKTISTKLNGLYAKKTYYVRVRTYKTVGGTKYYSGWSSYKYTKTK